MLEECKMVAGVGVDKSGLLHHEQIGNLEKWRFDLDREQWLRHQIPTTKTPCLPLWCTGEGLGVEQDILQQLSIERFTFLAVRADLTT